MIDAAVNARAIAIAAAVRDAALAGVRDVVSTYRSVAVYFDPLVVDVETSARRSSALRRRASSGVAAGKTVDDSRAVRR